MKANSASDQLDDKPSETDHSKFDLIPRKKEEEKREVLTPYIIKHLKKRRKLVAVNAYDATSAKMVDAAGVDIIIVDDKVGTHIYGLPTTQGVELIDMVRHTRAVAGSVKFALVVADMPYGYYQSPDDAFKSAQLLLEAGAKAVKIEGSPEIIRHLVNKAIPVVGHVGLLPQTMVGQSSAGLSSDEARRILVEAKAIEIGGAFLLLIECVPVELARSITKQVQIPTIGLGSGPDCNGQYLYSQDILGMDEDESLFFVKRYEELYPKMKKGIEKFVADVKEKKYPTKRFGIRNEQTKLASE